MARRKLLLLVLPITAAMWLIGWILCWASSENDEEEKTRSKKTHH